MTEVTKAIKWEKEVNIMKKIVIIGIIILLTGCGNSQSGNIHSNINKTISTTDAETTKKSTIASEVLHYTHDYFECDIDSSLYINENPVNKENMLYSLMVSAEQSKDNLESPYVFLSFSKNYDYDLYTSQTDLYVFVSGSAFFNRFDGTGEVKDGVYQKENEDYKMLYGVLYADEDLIVEITTLYDNYSLESTTKLTNFIKSINLTDAIIK